MYGHVGLILDVKDVFLNNHSSTMIRVSWQVENAPRVWEEKSRPSIVSRRLDGAEL